MKKLLNTLYITSPDAWVHRDGETVEIQLQGNKVGKLPVHGLESIVCMGYNVLMSPAVMELCASQGVSMVYLNQNGRFQARVEGPLSGNVLLRKEQYRISDEESRALPIAKACVAAKIQNSRSNLMRHLRNHQNTDGKEDIEKAINRLAILLKEAQDSATLDELRGYEGICADEYFSVFDHMIVAQKNDFRFLKRSRRPPLDRVNALLSFLYVLLAHSCRSALESVGLDPAVGFLHRDRPGRPSLALDLLEEFRHPIADRLVLSLINLQTVQAKDFIIGPTGAVEMSDDARKTIIQTWQKRKLDEVMHPYLEETISLGLFFHVQAQLLARTIRGDMKYYPAYMNR